MFHESIGIDIPLKIYLSYFVYVVDIDNESVMDVFSTFSLDNNTALIRILLCTPESSIQ